jgi:hypothetical protein
MSKLVIIFAIPLAMLLSSPVMAVKVVRRGDTAQKEQVSHQADPSSKPADSGMANPRDPAAASSNEGSRNSQPTGDKGGSRERQASPPPERRDFRGNDNFIDQNHDGIDDRLQRPPEVIKKKDPKQEHGPQQNPNRGSGRERQRQTEKEQTKHSR